MEKKTSIALFVMLLVTSTSYGIENQNLINACNNETLMFNKKGQKIGRKIDGYCAGYLTGVLDTLSSENNSICLKKDSVITPEYLLSVFHTYVKDKGFEKSAQNTLDKAYKRAFPCE